MSVEYTLTQKGNPAKPDAPKKFYANAKSNGEITFRSLNKEISVNSNIKNENYTI